MARDKAKQAASQKKYRAANREKINERDRTSERREAANAARKKRREDPAYIEKQAAYQKTYQAANRERRKEYWTANRESFNYRARERRADPANKEKEEGYRKNGAVRRKNYELKRRFGLSMAQYDEMLKQQSGSCAICGTPPQSIRLSVDHCHKTGKVRGLLCWKCNLSIGHFNDDPGLLLKAAAYLGNHGS